MMKDSTNYGVRAVERAGQVLAALGAADRPQTLSAIAAAAQLSLPTTLRLLRTLEAQGLVTWYRDEGRYTLGSRILELAQALLRQLDIVGIARPLLVAARDELGETTALAVRSGDGWVYVAQAESLQPLRRVVQIGERLPLYTGAAGRVFLAAFSEAELAKYLERTEFVPLSDTTPADPQTLRGRIEQARALGFGESVNERGAGGAGVSAPIYDHDGRVVATFSVSGPLSRFTAEARDGWIRAALFNAQRISWGLGYRGPANGLGGIGRHGSDQRVLAR